MIKYIPKFARDFLLAGVSLAVIGSSLLAYNANADRTYASELSQDEEYAIPLPTPTQAPQPADKRTGKKTNAIVTFFYCEQDEGYLKGDGGGYCGYFANGQKVKPELSEKVAACGRRWGFGTRIRIPEHGTVECVDRGYLEDNQIDVFFYRNSEGWNSRIPDIRYSEVEVLD